MNNKKILTIIGITLLFLLIGAVNAAENSTKETTVQNKQIDTTDSYNVKPIIQNDQSSQVSNNQKNVQKTSTNSIKCKVKTHDIKRRHGTNIKFAMWIKDNKNKPVDNLKLKLKRVYKGHSYTSYIRTSSGKGIKVYPKLGSGKHKIYITSANPKYKVSAVSTITIYQPKKVVKHYFFNTYSQKDYSKKIGKHSYLDVWFDDDACMYYVDLDSADGYKLKKVITFWQKIRQSGTYGKIINKAHYHFYQGGGIQTFGTKDLIGSWTLIGLRVYIIK